MRKITVAIDADGVLYDLLGPWLKLYDDVFDDDLSPDTIKQYGLQSYVKCDEESLHLLLQRADMWEQIKLYKGVKAAIEKLNSNPIVDLVIVTATSYKTCLPKFDKILRMLPMLREDQIIMTSRKDLIKANFLVDDWEDNLKDMASTKHGIPILVTQGYNKNFPNTQYGITRAKDSEEALQMIIDYIDKLQQLENM